MPTRTSIILATLLTFAAFAAGAYFYPALPAQIASHWGVNGAVNGYMPKFWGVFLFPLIMAIVIALLFAIPKLDPLKENIAAFRKDYNSFIVAFTAFFFYIYLLTLSWNLGYHFSFGIFLALPLAGLWFAIGALLPRTKRNWFIGIRTPWTVSNDRVWRETHMLGGFLFRISGYIALLGVAAPDGLIWFVVIPVIATTIVTVVYSYLLYQRYSKKVS